MIDLRLLGLSDGHTSIEHVMVDAAIYGLEDLVCSVPSLTVEPAHRRVGLLLASSETVLPGLRLQYLLAFL